MVQAWNQSANFICVTGNSILGVKWRRTIIEWDCVDYRRKHTQTKVSVGVRAV